MAEQVALVMPSRGGTQSGAQGTKIALAVFGGTALAAITFATFSARSSGKRTAAKIPQPTTSPPVSGSPVPVAPAQSAPETAPESRRPLPIPPRPATAGTSLVIAPQISIPAQAPPADGSWVISELDGLIWLPNEREPGRHANTGIVPPVETGVAVTRHYPIGPGEYDPSTGILNRTDRSLYSSELQRVEAAGLNVPPPSDPGNASYLQPGDPLVPDLSPEQYSTMWLNSYNEGYKYGARLKPADAGNKIVSLAHIDGQRAGFLGLAASPPAAEPGRTEYLQGYELGRVTDKQAGGVALVKAEASAWGSWDAVRGVPARSGPPAHHVSAASA